MGYWSFSVCIIILALLAYWYGNTKAIRENSGLDEHSKLPSLPKYYGNYSTLWLFIPSILGILLWLVIKPFAINSLLTTYLENNLNEKFTINLDMIVSRVKSININNPFPGTSEELIKAVFLRSRG